MEIVGSDLSMTTTPNMGLDLPALGGDAGTWDDKINAALSKIDLHTHIAGSGVPVTTAGISINADLTFSSLYAPINLHRITFASILALTSSNKSLFVSNADNELYWRNNVGTNVKLTLGNALNVGAFVGGIGGDYSAVGAALNFDDAGDRYTLKQQGGVWARMASGDVRLFETGTSDAVFVGLAAPAALASSYTLTMPLVLPGVAGLLAVSSSGVITTTPTLPAVKGLLAVDSAGVFTTTPTLPSGIRVMQIDNTGAVTTPAAALPASQAAMMISGAGVITYQGGPDMYSAAFAVPLSATPQYFVAQEDWTINNTGQLSLPIKLPVGSSFTSWKVYFNKSSNASTTITASLRRYNLTLHTATQVTTTNTSANAPGPVQLTAAGETILADCAYSILVTGGVGSTLDTMCGWSVLV